MKQLGYTNLDDDTVEDLVSQFKAVADVKKQSPMKTWKHHLMIRFSSQGTCGLGLSPCDCWRQSEPTATVTLRNAEGDEFSEASLEMAL